VITDVATGDSFGDLLLDEDRYEYLQATANSMPAMTMAGVVPATMKLLQIPWIGRFVYPSATEEKGVGRLIGFAQKLVAERFSPDSKTRISKPDMLGSFINHGLTQEEAVSESLLQILAGSDTSATAIRAIMLFIMTSPLVYNKLQAEIDSFAASSKLDTIISDAQARELPYLQAVIREGLRIFPAGPGTMSKVVPPEGDTINGVFVPGGTNIGHSVWSFMRSTEYWGQDATVFRPERWLEASPENRKQMENVADMLFGYGKYKCLGMNIALMELNKVFFEVCLQVRASSERGRRPKLISAR
jgi:cytochrome P450